MTPSKVAFAVNEETIWRSTCVYAFDKSLAKFVTMKSTERRRENGSQARVDQIGAIASLAPTIRCQRYSVARA